jgi:hypothetical protein
MNSIQPEKSSPGKARQVGCRSQIDGLVEDPRDMDGLAA